MPAALAEDRGRGGTVPGAGVEVGGVQVAGHERGQRSGLFPRGSDRLGGGQGRGFGAPHYERAHHSPDDGVGQGTRPKLVLLTSFAVA